MTDKKPEPETLDLEEMYRVIEVGENRYVGAHPLKLPLEGARGVYGGHTVAQTMRVAIQSSPGYRPQSFHSFFSLPGMATVPMEFEVLTLSEDADVVKKSIKASQKGKVRFLAVVVLVKRGPKRPEHIEFQRPPPQLHHQNPDDLHQVVHSVQIRNAYDDKFVDHKLVPEEARQDPADRWINIYSGVVQPDRRFKEIGNNFVAVGELSDAVFLTALARILHAPWNPTESKAFQEVDLERDARVWMNISLNVLHVFHYNAMSLDHHLYFHTDFDEFDLSKDWLSFSYQARRLNNNRTLVRGYMYDKDGKHVVTVAQEGLTIGFKGFDMVKL